MEDMTNPETEVVESDITETEAAEEVETEVEADESGESENQEPEDDGEEVEFEGKQYKLPKELKDALLRQADYTRKTQEVAETRRQLEAEAASFQQRVQVQQQSLNDYAHLMTIDQQLEQFNQIDWQAASDSDPVAAQKLWFQYQTLQNQRGQVATRITQAQQMQFHQQQEQLAKLTESGAAELRRDIANWSPELAASLKSYGVEKAGFSEQELAGIYDARQVKVLHKAFLYDQLMSQKSTKPKPEAQKPITTVKAKSTATAKDPEKMSTEEWLKWREAQLRKSK